MPEKGFKTPQRTPNKVTQEVPEDFVVVSAVENTACPLLEDSKKNKEFWIIKVPDNFDAKCLSGKTVVLNGVQDVQNKQNPDERFELLAKPLSQSTSSTRVLIPSSSEDSTWSAKTVKGSMSVIKSISIPPADDDLLKEDRQNVQAPEVRCRWKPFGHKHPYKIEIERTKGRQESETPKKKRKKHS